MEETYYTAFQAGEVPVSVQGLLQPESDCCRMSYKPPLLAMLMAPFILLYIKILDLIEWIKKNRNDKNR